MQRTRIFIAGFSLLEISISLVIIAILAYTITNGIGITRGYDKVAENRVYMQGVKKALTTFVQVNGYMPCPDTDVPQDGIENRDGANQCTNTRGRLPYMMLGVKESDVWNQPLRYVVNGRADSADIDDATGVASATFFNNEIARNPFVATPRFTLNTLPSGLTDGAGNLRVCGESLALAAACGAATPEAALAETTAIAVVVSFGLNGADTWAGNAVSAPEIENSDNDNNFWQAEGSLIAGQEFDDQLVWITGHDVKYAMLRSERGLQ